jgi:anti-anti-sigma regulatory factor
MSQKFQAAVQHRGDVSYVKLTGVIDEDNELGELVDKIPNGTAVIDLGEVERINSCGVRDWVNWLGKLEKNGSRAVLVECSPAIVAQINLVNNFTGQGVVKSFYVPYFCPECDEEKVLLVDAGDMGPPPHEPPTCRCDECDLVMDFDDMPDSYFAFLSNQRKLTASESTSFSAAGATVAASGTGVGDPNGRNSGKVKSRASQPSMGGPGPRQDVPSLPSIQRSSTAPAGQTPQPQMMQSHQQMLNQTGSQQPISMTASQSRVAQKPPSRPLLPPNGQLPGMNGSPSRPGAAAFSSQFQIQPGMSGLHTPPVAAPKGNALVYILILILVGAIGVLAYLVLTK